MTSHTKYKCWRFVACLLLGAHAIASAAGESHESAKLILDQLPSVAVHLQREEAGTVARIYAESGYAFYWVEGGQPTSQARVLVEALKNAGDYGLRPSDYEELVRSAESLGLKLRWKDTSAQAYFDLTLTAAAIRFVSHLHSGRITSRSAGFELPDRSEFNVPLAVRSLSRSNDLITTLANYEPRSAMFHRLKDALRLYRTLARDAELSNLSRLPKLTLEVGDRYEDAARLRRLLAAFGDGTFGKDVSDLYDSELATAIAKFQQRHGLQVDGRIGAKTFAALTMPLDRRVRQIELALERWRWLPELHPPLVVINIPEFMLFALPYADNAATQIPLEIPVVVGRSGSRTPIFMSAIEAVVFNPYWNVPRGILTRELLPHIRRDADYLERYQMEIVRGAGDDAVVVPLNSENLEALTNGKLRVRQRPGPLNALGQIKFILPNRYNVYLHGSPETQLFSEQQRSFSHGCVRVSDPAALAEYALRQTEEWNLERVVAAMCGLETITVRLHNKIPILLFYSTAVATATRGVLFFEDIYGHDHQLETLLGLDSLR